MARREAEAAAAVIETVNEDGSAQIEVIDAPEGEGTELSNNTRKLSPKHKLSRGIDPSLITTWVPVDSTPEDNARLRKVARARGVKVADVLLDILNEQLADEDVIALLEEDAAKAPEVKPAKKDVPLPDDPEEAEKVLRAQAEKAMGRLAKAEKAMENARKAIEAAKAKAQERGITADLSAADDDSDGAVA